jgi:hypothetical protein
MAVAESNVSRTHFLRQLGVGLAAGVGVMAAPRLARAGSSDPQKPDVYNNCCPSSCKTCVDSIPIHCDCGLCCSYCFCSTQHTSCYVGPC